MAAKFTPAPQVKEAAEPIISEHHEHLIKHQVRIEYLFTDKAQTTGGKQTWGTARKISSLAAFLAGEPDRNDDVLGEPFFVITIWEDLWKRLDEPMRAALLDHELCHCGAEYDDKGKTKLFIIPHDLEEFSAIYARHGAWSAAIREFLRAGMDAGQTDFGDFSGFGENGANGQNGNGNGHTRIDGNPRRQLTAAPPRALPEPMKALAAPAREFVNSLVDSDEDDENVIDAEFSPTSTEEAMKP